MCFVMSFCSQCFIDSASHILNLVADESADREHVDVLMISWARDSAPRSPSLHFPIVSISQSSAASSRSGLYLATETDTDALDDGAVIASSTSSLHRSALPIRFQSATKQTVPSHVDAFSAPRIIVQDDDMYISILSDSKHGSASAPASPAVMHTAKAKRSSSIDV